MTLGTRLIVWQRHGTFGWCVRIVINARRGIEEMLWWRGLHSVAVSKIRKRNTHMTTISGMHQEGIAIWLLSLIVCYLCCEGILWHRPMTSSYDIVLVSPKFRRSVSPATHVFCMNTTTCWRSEAAWTLRPLIPPAIVPLRVHAVCIKPLRDEAVCIQSKTNYKDVIDERLWESVRNWNVGMHNGKPA